jgi:hypothetical protein
MELTKAQRAEILIQALPYIQKYNNKIIVVKYGGNAMLNDELKEAVMGDLVLLSLVGVKVVLLHGVCPEMKRRQKLLIAPCGRQQFCLYWIIDSFVFQHSHHLIGYFWAHIRRAQPRPRHSKRR